MIIELPGERPISWNQFYESKHWIFRKNAADTAHQLIAYVLRDMGITPYKPRFFETPVDITIIMFYTKRAMDSDNINGKILIDGLKKLVLYDDDPRYVRKVTTWSQKTTSDGIQIHVTPVDE